VSRSNNLRIIWISPVKSCVSWFLSSPTELINVVRPLWPVYSRIGESQVNRPSSKRKCIGLSWGGTLPIGLLLAAQARGLQTENSSGTLKNLKAEIDAHHPVVALLNLGWAVFPQGHYVVITGYDERQQGVYMHSGLSRDLFVPYTQFFINWEKTGRWMLRLQPMERHVTVLDRIDRMDE